MNNGHINSEIKKEIIDSLPNLKYIVTRSTGYDHIDGAYAKEKNIGVSNVPSYGSDKVAEFTFGLILNLSRKIFQASHQVKEGGVNDLKEFWMCDMVVRSKNQNDDNLLFLREIEDAKIVKETI